MNLDTNNLDAEGKSTVCREGHGCLTAPGFSRVDRDAMMAQLGGQERSGPRRLQPRVSRRLGRR